MDVKSMLNESNATRPPRLQTPQSSYDARTERTPGSDVSSARPTLHNVNLPSIDSRVNGSDGYFTLQSPYLHSGSTSAHSAGHSAYTQSPSQYAHTPRDHSLPNLQHAPVVSPSPSQYPPTPGSAHLPPTHPIPVFPHSALTPGQTFQSPPPPLSNGLPHTRSVLPVYTSALSSQPATPLGPPLTYPRASPHAQQRSPSEGYDTAHLRGHSQTSTISAHRAPSRENSYPQVQQPQRQEQRQESIRTDSVNTYSYDSRGREESLEVSPKTIPRPSPYHEPLVPSGEAVAVGSSVVDKPLPLQAPAMANPNNYVAGSKRSASEVSDMVSRQDAPRKRVRREDIPVWAHAARDKPRFLNSPGGSQPSLRQRLGEHGISQVARREQPRLAATVQKKPTESQTSHTALDGLVNGTEEKIMASIANIEPAEDLTRQITEWLAHQVLSDTTPTGGGIIEVEAKIGTIVDVDDVSHRVCRDYPIMSETIFDRDKYDRVSGRRAKFQSSMKEQQHKILNQYLNSLTDEYHKAKSTNTDPGRPPISYQHTRETDIFFQLSDEGRRHLPADLIHWISRSQRSREIRVRKTINEATGQLIASIIKIRLYDKDIFNPRFDFDYRISVSLEYPWQGPDQHLTPLNSNSNNNNLIPQTPSKPTGRSKDRLSYRSQYYQVDLTQVHTSDSTSTDANGPTTPQKDHELEIEIDPTKLKDEFARAVRGQSSQYEVLVRGLLDNVRLLSRKASVGV